MQINKVTFTGADTRVKPTDLIAISSCYPYVEWGILFPNAQKPDMSRFPTNEWVGELVNEVRKFRKLEINLSAHICEPYTQAFITEGDILSIINTIGIDNIPTFKRIQLNLHGIPLTAYSSGCLDAIHALPQEVIVQADRVNSWIVNALKETSILYDTSSGAGLFPNQWPYHRGDRPFGYAGGLNIDTLPIALEEWQNRDQTFWIDMETGVRSRVPTKFYDEFDLDKVVDVLELIDPYVSKE